MRIILASDQFSHCHRFDQTILRRLLNRYGPKMAIDNDNDTDVDEAVKLATKGMRIRVEEHLADSVQ